MRGMEFPPQGWKRVAGGFAPSAGKMISHTHTHTERFSASYPSIMFYHKSPAMLFSKGAKIEQLQTLQLHNCLTTPLLFVLKTL